MTNETTRKQHNSIHKRKPISIPAPGEIFISQDYCDGCGECVTNCPNNALVIRDITDAEFNKLEVLVKLRFDIKEKKKASVNNIEECTSYGR